MSDQILQRAAVQAKLNPVVQPPGRTVVAEMNGLFRSPMIFINPPISAASRPGKPRRLPGTVARHATRSAVPRIPSA
jgi:hypothetical protein